MKLVGKIVGIVAAVLLLAAALFAIWLYFYTGDLPSIAELSQYDPATASEIHVRTADGADSIRHVVPSSGFGKYLMNALIAAEGQPEGRGPIRATAVAFLTGKEPSGTMYSWQIARGLGCGGRSLHYQLCTIRTAQQIERRFDQQQVLTIYLNRVYVGENTFGVEDGAMRYFGQHAADLQLSDAALVVDLIRSPVANSPITHPDRAVQWRNRVIDQMLSQGMISTGEADEAKTEALVVKKTADSKPEYDVKRCEVKLLKEMTFDHNWRLKLHPGEKFTTHAVVISYQIEESGELSHLVLVSSSGMADYDQHTIEAIKAMRYSERPPGCGRLDGTLSVNMDVLTTDP